MTETDQSSGETTQEYTEDSSFESTSDENLDAFLQGLEQSSDEETEKEAGASQQQQDEKPEQVTMTKAEHDALLAKLNKQETINNNNQEFIQRREQQFGSIRNQLANTQQQLVTARQQLVAEFNKAQEEDRNMDAVEVRDKIKAVDQQLGNVQQQNNAVNKIQSTQKIVAQHLQPDDILPEDIEDCLRRDGYDDNAIANFKQRMYLDWSPEGIINLAKRAQAERAVREVVGIAKTLSERLKQLEAGEGADNVLQRVERELSKTPQITAASSGSNSGRNRAPIDPDSIDTTKLSDAELNKLLGIA